jgi:hypothetical protein
MFCMSDADTLFEQDAQRARQLAERQLEQLAELAEIGLQQARDGGDYAAITRSIRLTHQLQARISKALSWLVQQQVKGVYAAEDRRERSTPQYIHKAKIERLIERAVEAHTDDEDEREDLICEGAERLDREDFGDLLERPVEELVRIICKSLRIDPPKLDIQTRPPPLAGEGVSSVATNGLVAMRTPAEERAGEAVERAWSASDLFQPANRPYASG